MSGAGGGGGGAGGQVGSWDGGGVQMERSFGVPGVRTWERVWSPWERGFGCKTSGVTTESESI